MGKGRVCKDVLTVEANRVSNALSCVPGNNSPGLVEKSALSACLVTFGFLVSFSKLGKGLGLVGAYFSL